MSRNEVLVSADWAQENIGAPGIVFVEVDEDTSAYDKGHIEGAVKLDWRTDLQDPLDRKSTRLNSSHANISYAVFCLKKKIGTVRHPLRFKIVVIDIQITLKQMLRDFIGIRVNRAKNSGMVNITSSVNSRERSGINTILHELNPLFTINVTMRDIKSKNVYSRVNSKATTQWRKTESANGVHLEGVASDNRSS